MKVARCSNGGPAVWAVVDAECGVARPFAGTFAEWAPRLTESFDGSLLQFSGEEWPLDEVHLLPPIERGAQVVVVGANYLTHLNSDFKMEPPKEPAAFLKSFRALVGARDVITFPPITAKLDFEVELVAVIGAPVDRANPLRSVLGYTVGNDVSARDLQKGSVGIGMDLFSAKSLDGSTPLGPWIVTRDEFGDASPDLRLTLQVNGEMRQDDRTDKMRWGVGELIQFVDQRVAFEPGDVMFTGTPAGVAHGDGRYLLPGDVVEASIERIGTQRNVVAEKK